MQGFFIIYFYVKTYIVSGTHIHYEALDAFRSSLRCLSREWYIVEGDPHVGSMLKDREFLPMLKDGELWPTPPTVVTSEKLVISPQFTYFQD